MANILVQRKYAERIAPYLEQSIVRSRAPLLINFRCHICGDSQKKKFKKRGYLIENSKGLKYVCHNCGANILFGDYLKTYHSDVYRQYMFDIFPGRTYVANQVEPIQQTTTNVSNYLHGLERLDSLPRDHRARLYVDSRKIPESRFGDIYYCERFYRYINNIVPLKFAHSLEKNNEHDRLIFPMIDQSGEIFGVIGRAFDDNGVRYITIKFNSQANKIFGLNHLDLRRHAYVVEGPIDSLFINNTIALAGTDGNPDQVFLDKKQYTMILDNQPRNKEVISKYDKYIANGCQIVIWPDNVIPKDINELILNGYSIQDVIAIVQTHTYSGLKAKVNFNRWKKI